MEFISTERFGSGAEEVLWDALKQALADEPGYCWHRYPITNVSGIRLEPDIVILHPQWGIIVVEVKGCRIEDIEAIEGYIWYMRNTWYEEEMHPVEQAEHHMWAVIDRMKKFRHGLLRNASGDCKIWGTAFISIPFITEQEWKQQFDENISAPLNNVIFSSDLEPNALLRRLKNAPKRQGPLTDEEWRAATALLQGTQGIQKKLRRPTKRQDSRAALLRKVEQQISALDLQQHKVAVQVPEGPQRIRGLAGSGKTVVLAQKAAYMHVKHPEWHIVFTFYSQSLYDQVRKLITRFVQEFSQGEIDEPNWDKIHVWHAWGSSTRGRQLGFYRYMCKATGRRFFSYTEACNYFGTKSGRAALDHSVAVLMEHEIPELFDAILIDEAQDFGTSFFQLCYLSLRDPRRIIWGYDEIQSLEVLEIPTAETLFGSDEDGQPLVDLDGEYPGEIEKDMILYHCYRNPRPVLIAAHAFGLGLRRREGAIQFIDTVGGWQDIGYQVVGQREGTLRPGTQLTLTRPQENSPHMLETLAGYHNLVSWHSFPDRDEELEWIVDDIVRNIQHEEIQPEEIAIIALNAHPRATEVEYEQLKMLLERHNIESVRVGTDARPDVFRVRGAVTITSAYRAKGNEASIVYVYGFEDVGGRRDAIQKRNRAFTAMTRTRGWLVLTGVGRMASELFEEIAGILEEVGKVTFVVPDMSTIQRNLETYENQRRRARIKKAAGSLTKLIQDLADVDPDELSEEQRKQLFRLLFSKKGTPPFGGE